MRLVDLPVTDSLIHIDCATMPALETVDRERIVADLAARGIDGLSTVRSVDYLVQGHISYRPVADGTGVNAVHAAPQPPKPEDLHLLYTDLVFKPTHRA